MTARQLMMEIERRLIEPTRAPRDSMGSVQGETATEVVTPAKPCHLRISLA